MKQAVMMLLCICSSSVLQAQDGTVNSDKKMEIRFSNGAAFPLNTFKATEGIGAGYANTGYKGALDISYKLNPHFGLGLLMNYASHGTNAAKKAEGILQANPSYKSVTVESGPFSIYSFMLAPEYTLYLKDRCYVQGQVGFGIAHVQGTEEHITVQSPSPYIETNTGGAQNSFAYQGQVSFGYKLKPSFGLGLYANYFATKSQFSYEGEDVSQKISSFSVGLQLIAYL